MTNILTTAEAADTLRVEATDPDMLQLLPLVDTHIKNATGRDWSTDNPIDPTAKTAARILLVMWYENPGMMGQGIMALQFGLTAAIVQLQAIALQYKQFSGREDAGAVALPGAQVGDTVASLVGLIGVTGDQSASFESVITVADQIQQTATDDLSANYYRARLVPLEEL